MILRYILNSRPRDSLWLLTKDAFTTMFLRKMHSGCSDAELAYEYSMSEGEVNSLLNELILFIYTTEPRLIEKRNLSQPM